MRTSRIPLLMILAIALAACGEQAASAAASDAASLPPASAGASTEPSEGASAEASAAGSEDGGSAALDCDALEALMPSSVGEATIVTTCLSGEEILQAGGSVPLDELENAGVDMENAAVAIGSGSSGSAGVFMYSLPGADTPAFRDQMAQGLQQALAGEFSTRNVGGKEVLAAEGGQGLPANHYLYVADDLIVWVLAPDDEAAADVLADLP